MQAFSLVLLALAAFSGCAMADETSTAKKGPMTPVTALLTVHGEDGHEQQFNSAALAKLPQQTVHAEAHGNAVTCSGPNLIEVVAAAGAPSGEKLRGRNLALYVRVSAADGYRAVFALAELDPGMRDAVPIVTDRCEGAALDAKDGPFRIVVPGEKRPARWARQVTSIDVLSAP